jgi:transposase
MNHLNEEKRKLIRDLFQKTASIRATAELAGVSRNAVRRELRRLAIPRAVATVPRKSKLDDFKDKIRYLVVEKHLSAVRVLEEISPLGYQGGYSILKDYVRIIRPKGRKRPTAPLPHSPGVEAQMDWSPHPVILGGREQIVHTGSIVLCFSRWLFFRHFPDQTLGNVIRLHQEAFMELGAVPQTITYDNMTTVGRHTGPGQVWINPVFKTFADTYGFQIIILPPGAKERHGIVERPFHYIENNFLAGREFADMEDINSKGDFWRANTANVRIHGTLRERPVDRLQRERPFLQPLPQTKADTFYREVARQIHTDFCVAVDTNRYSASPHLIGLDAKVRLYKDHLEIWVNSKLDCQHTYVEGRFQRQVLPEHEKAFKEITGQHQLLKDTFLRLGPQAESYYEGLRRERGAGAGYHLQRILKLADRYGSDVIAGALTHAMRYGAFSADAVLRITQGKALRVSQQAPVQTIPEEIRNWLRSCAVESQDPQFYDQLLGETSDKDEKEEP